MERNLHMTMAGILDINKTPTPLSMVAVFSGLKQWRFIYQKKTYMLSDSVIATAIRQQRLQEILLHWHSNYWEKRKITSD